MGKLILQPGLFEGEIPAHKPILRVMLELHVPLNYSCRRGLCGQDLIRIVSGWEHLNPIGELEEGTLELLRARGKHMRLACCAMVFGPGPVVVELVK